MNEGIFGGILEAFSDPIFDPYEISASNSHNDSAFGMVRPIAA
jgi:hypothetical protein